MARATGRKFVRMALGGMRDEAEIRGHRRTYIGSMPGKVLQSLSKVGTRNPLFLLDEIDKLGMDFRGDPSSGTVGGAGTLSKTTPFSDHYVEVDFDLSDVMFVATSNSMNIPPALLDRMEVIRLSGYTEDEKLNIAQRYLATKQAKNNGVKDSEMELTESGIRGIIRYYTREAGVRSLEREISKICRKVVKGHQLKQYAGKVVVTEDNLNDFLGVRKFDFGPHREEESGGPGGGSGVDRGGWRSAHHRSHGDARQGQHHPYRVTGRRHERVGGSRTHRGAFARAPAGSEGRDFREARHPHSRARRRYA